MRPLTAAILSERRAVAPFGVAGGGSAQRGLNLVLKKDGHTVNIGAKSVVELQVRRADAWRRPDCDQYTCCALLETARAA